MNEEKLQQYAACDAAEEAPAATAVPSAETDESAENPANNESEPPANSESEPSANSESEPPATVTTGVAATAEEPSACADAVQAPVPPDIDRLIAEAELRGYMRGRNERIEQLMHPVESPADDGVDPDPDRPSEVLILNNLRESVWS